MHEGWSERTIGECLSAEFAGEWGSAPSAGGNATILRSTDLDDEGHVAGGVRRTIVPAKLLSKKLQVGDILLEASGGGPAKPVGRVALFRGAEGAHLCSNFFRTLRPNPATVDPCFMAWCLQHLYARPEIWALQQQTTGIINLKYRDYLRTAVKIPPLAEQRRIAEILDTLDEALRRTGQFVAKLKQIKQGLLHDLLTRGIDENGELRDPARYRDRFKDSNVGLIPKAWRASRLGDEFTLQRGFDITVAEQRQGDVPVVSSSGITSYHSKAMVSGPGVVTGRKGKLGDAYFLDGPFWPHDTTLWVKNFHGNDVRFGALFLQSLRLERFDAATSVPTLNRNFIHPLPIAVPPVNEQKRIVEVAIAGDARIAEEERTAQKLHLIKNGLVEDLLTGRVRVTRLLDEKAA